MDANEKSKKAVGEYAVRFIQQDMVVGIGTGSTVYWFIEALGRKVKEGLHIKAVPTSTRSKEQAAQSGIPLLVLNDVSSIDITIDGADEIDHELNVIKGGGGALLQEKMVAAASGKLIIIADYSKYVTQLGAVPLPVEVVPYGWKQVQRKIQHYYSTEVRLRMQENKPYITDHGHYILDCHFGSIPDASSLSKELHNIPGVVEHGLFIHMVYAAVIGKEDGGIQTIERDIRSNA